MDYQVLERTKGRSARLLLLGCRIMVYDFGYIDGDQADVEHQHPFYEFNYIVRGQAKMKVGDRTYLLEEEQLLFIDSGQKHRFLADESENCAYVYVTFDIAWGKSDFAIEGSGYEDLVEDEEYLIRNLLDGGSRCTPDRGGCKKSLLDMIECLKNAYLGDIISVLAYQTCFFMAAFRNFSDMVTRKDFALQDQRFSKKTSIQAVRIAEYLWENCVGKMSLQQAAEELGYSVRSIQRMLSDFYAVGYGELLSRYRVEHLKRALKAGTDTLESFSEKCGYQDTRSLERSFRKVTGKSVAQYRRQLGRE